LGASAGAIGGPLLATIFIAIVGSKILILWASFLMLFSLPLTLYLQNLKSTEFGKLESDSDLSNTIIGGNPLEGFKDFVFNPYLIGIAFFILLYTAISSFAYFEQTNLLRDYSLDDRAGILSILALVVNVLTFGLGFFVTGRLATRWGMPITLSVVPFLMCGALLVLAFAPMLTVLLLLQIVRQAGNYGVTKPAREMLFAAVTRESRFKSKPVVDVAIYRGGDAIWSSVFAFLTDGIGIGIAAMAAIGAGIAGIWAAVGLFLGREFDLRINLHSTSKVSNASKKIGMND